MACAHIFRRSTEYHSYLHPLRLQMQDSVFHAPAPLYHYKPFQAFPHSLQPQSPHLYGRIFSIVIFSYYFLLHNVRIKRYFSPNLIPTNYSTLCSSRNFIICLYIQHKSHSTDYSSKEWLSLFLSDTYGKYTRIFIFTQKNQLTVSWFLIVPSKLHTC